METFIVEVRNRRSELLERRKVETFPLQIGRAYDNDLIVDDNFVSPKHLRILLSESGTIAEDLESLNGIFENGSRTQCAAVPLEHGTELRIGETTLRFIDPTKPVDPALPLSASERHLLPARIHVWHGVAVFVCSLLLSALQGYFFEYSAEKSPFLKLMLYGLIAALLLWLPWAGVWALVGRVAQRRAHFFAHLTAVALASYLLGMLWLGTEYVEFAFGSPAIGGLLTFILFAVWGFALLRFHLSCATRLPLRLIRLASGGVIAFIIGLVILYESTDALDFSDELPLQTTIKPRSFRLVDSLQVDDFVAKAANLEAELIDLAKDK